MNTGIRKLLTAAGIYLLVFLCIRYLLPMFMPFLLGTALALASEPLVRFLNGKLRLPRTAAAAIGVSMSFSLLALAIMLLCALLVRQLRQLSVYLPELEDAARSGMQSLSDWLMALAEKTPDGIRGIATQNVTDLFSSGSALIGKVTGYLLSLASGILSRVPDSALGFGTAIISSFMISAKLPKLRAAICSKVPQNLKSRVSSVTFRLKQTVGGWLRAQVKLSGVNFLLITLGFFLLRIPYAPLWAFLVALVDAFPVLGTGTVLVPWSVISFFQGDRLLAFGLLGVYAAASIARSVLEPRLVGHQLGLDPLATLIALYAGYQLWGLPGMLLTPIIASAAVQFAGGDG